MTHSRIPLIAAVLLLLLPMLYVSSYLMLVVPPGKPGFFGPQDYYRIRGKEPVLFFYPLEQIDRKLRPETWYLPPPTYDPLFEPDAGMP